jgi:hypothetical protein
VAAGGGFDKRTVTGRRERLPFPSPATGVAVNHHVIPGIGAHGQTRLEPEHLERLSVRIMKRTRMWSSVVVNHRALSYALDAGYRESLAGRSPGDRERDGR